MFMIPRPAAENTSTYGQWMGKRINQSTVETARVCCIELQCVHVLPLVVQDDRGRPLGLFQPGADGKAKGFFSRGLVSQASDMTEEGGAAALI